jgi:hypothetical protein
VGQGWARGDSLALTGATENEKEGGRIGGARGTCLVAVERASWVGAGKGSGMSVSGEDDDHCPGHHQTCASRRRAADHVPTGGACPGPWAAQRAGQAGRQVQGRAGHCHGCECSPGTLGHWGPRVATGRGCSGDDDSRGALFDGEARLGLDARVGVVDDQASLGRGGRSTVARTGC